MNEIIDIPQGYFRTKLGNIPIEWKKYKLGEVCEKIQDGTHFSPKVTSQGTRLYITSKNIRLGKLDLSNVAFISEEDHIKIYKRCNVKKNDILITKDGANTGNVCINTLDEEFSLLSSVAFLRSKKSIVDNGFLFQLLASPRSQYKIKESMAGQAITRITLKKLRGFQYYFPPLPEQQKIAEILSTWDQAIATTQKLIDELKLRNKGLAQQLLTGKKRLKGFEGVWREITLKDIAERVTRKNEELDDTVVTISAQRGFVLQEDFFTKRVASETLSNYYLIHKGEFAYNKSYSKGYPMGAFKRLNDFDKAVVTTLYICFSLKENVNSDFMCHFFEGGLMTRPLMKIAQEGGRAHGLLNIGIHDFFGLKLTIPILEEQKAINSLLSEADKELKLYEQHLDTLKEQKKGLMQKLLTGEIRVKISNE